MTERDYQCLLDTVQNAIDAETGMIVDHKKPAPASPANDNSVEWPLLPFPKGWHATS